MLNIVEWKMSDANAKNKKVLIKGNSKLALALRKLRESLME